MVLLIVYFTPSLGFLNVDDDEVDEDHEEDGVEEGDEARLLENSGWSSRTRSVELIIFFSHNP